MRAIRILYGSIMDEVDGASEYASYASMYKDSDPELHKMFISLASTEIEHAKTLMAHLDRKQADIQDAGWAFEDLMSTIKAAAMRQLAEAKAAVELAK